jgi:hypothetical protein
MSQDLCAGNRVTLVGLVGRPELNGQEATLLFQSADRWAIRCTVSNEAVRVKSMNLQLCPDLHARLSNAEDMLSSVLTFCDASEVRTVRLVDRSFKALANTALTSCAWRRAVDARHLAAWQASHPVFTLSYINEQTQRFMGPTPAAPSALCRSGGGRFVAHVTAKGPVEVRDFGRPALAHEIVFSAVLVKDKKAVPVHFVTLSDDGSWLALGSNRHVSRLAESQCLRIAAFKIPDWYLSSQATRASAPARPLIETKPQLTFPSWGRLDALEWGGGSASAADAWWEAEQDPFLLCVNTDYLTESGSELCIWPLAQGTLDFPDGDEPVASFRLRLPHRFDAVASWRSPCAPEGSTLTGPGKCMFAIGYSTDTDDEGDGSFGGLLLIYRSSDTDADEWQTKTIRDPDHAFDTRFGAVALVSVDGRHDSLRVVTASQRCEHSASLSVWEVATATSGPGTCICRVDYHAVIRQMNWYMEQASAEYAHEGEGEGEDQEDEEVSDDEGSSLEMLGHQFERIDVSGGMVATADRCGVLCVWEMGQRGAQGLRLVAHLPPMGGLATNLRGLAITQTGGAEVAGRCLVYSTRDGMLGCVTPRIGL